jgi:hypothetical protein
LSMHSSSSMLPNGLV